ncbi:MAG: SDR family oxidoreductase [Bauldia sp.]|nr:SDR family oxidoreductase [Bauldia sp.]
MTTRYDFTNRSAVVTGGAQGIGRAVVEVLLSGGASVAIWDRDKALADQTAADLNPRGTVIPVAVDVADAGSVDKAHAETLSRLGKVDILVNNAGVAGVNAKVADYPIEEWDRVIAINLRSQFLCCRAVIRGMIAQNYGRICNVASIAGKEGNPTASAYSASKAGVIALTKSLAKEVAEHNISVNAIAPAAARTKIFDQVSDQHIAYMLAKIPRGRFLQVEEAAAMIAFIVSEECSFTTGFAFDISGGRATY